MCGILRLCDHSCDHQSWPSAVSCEKDDQPSWSLSLCHCVVTPPPPPRSGGHLWHTVPGFLSFPGMASHPHRYRSEPDIILNLNKMPVFASMNWMVQSATIKFESTSRKQLRNGIVHIRAMCKFAYVRWLSYWCNAWVRYWVSQPPLAWSTLQPNIFV